MLMPGLDYKDLKLCFAIKNASGEKVAVCPPLMVRAKYLTSRFPMRQIGAFRPLRKDFARLRDRRMSWIVAICHWQKVRPRFF